MEKRLKLFDISKKKERECKTKIENKINYQILIIFFIFSYSIGIKLSPFGICYDSIISIIIQKNVFFLIIFSSSLFISTWYY